MTSIANTSTGSAMFFRLCGPSWRIAMPSVSRTARRTALVTQMPPGWAERLEARRDADAVTLDAGLAAEQHLADVDADAKRDRLVVALPHRLVAELPLDRDRELQCLRGTLEQGEDAVAGDVLDVTAIVAHQRSDQPHRLGHPLIGAVLVLGHQAAVAVHVGEQDRRKLPTRHSGRLFGHGPGFS